MKLTFEKFNKFNIWPPDMVKWMQGDYYIPDEVGGPFWETFRRSAMPNYFVYWATLDNLTSQTIRTIQITEDESKKFTLDLCAELGEDYFDFVKKSFECRNPQRLKIGTGPNRSFCREDCIEWYRDGNLIDNITLPHEIGHWFEKMTAPSPEQSRGKKSVVEIQAFFMQEMAYDKLQESFDESIGGAAFLHRLKDHFYSIYQIPVRLFATAQAKGFKNPEIILKEWGFSQAEQNHATSWLKEGKNADDAIMDLHTYSFASPISIAFYQKYKIAKSEQRQVMLKALYQSGSNVSLQSVLKAFGITTIHQLTTAANYAANELEKGFKRLGFLPGKTQQFCYNSPSL